jgi:hypothetical protein
MASRPDRWHGGRMLTSRTSRLCYLTIVAALLAAASTALAASAATQRYASPNGLGDCSAASPCSITEAVQNASAGDEVIVTPGDYSLTATLDDPAPITIHGVAGQPRPRLQFSGPVQQGLLLNSGSTVRYLELRQTSSGGTLIASSGSVVDQVVAEGSAGAATAVKIQSATIRNSVVVSPAPSGTAIETITNGGPSTSTYRNVTAIATGSGGAAIEAEALGAAGKATINLVNVIAKGGPLGASLSMQTDNSGASATITASHTNWANYLTAGTNTNYVNLGGNQGTPASFANPAGDYRQAPGSVTIDAGLDDDPANGAFDVDGDPRQIGTTDIGADEFFVAPPPPPTPTPPPPTSPAPSPTPPPPAPSSTTRTSTTPTRAFAGVTLVSTRPSFGGKFITLKLSCPAETIGRCSGRTKLTARRRAGSGAARTVTLGRAPFSIAPRKQGKVRVRVSRAGRRLLDGVRRVRGTNTNAARDGAAGSKTTVAAVTIRPRQR